MQYAFFSLFAAINFLAASVDNTPFPYYQADMGNVEESFSLGLNTNNPSPKNFIMSVSPHQKFYYSIFTVDDDVTGLELGYHPRLWRPGTSGWVSRSARPSRRAREDLVTNIPQVASNWKPGGVLHCTMREPTARICFLSLTGFLVGKAKSQP